MPPRASALPLLVAALLPACTSDESIVTRPPPSVDARALGWIHAEQGRLVDEWGRERTLRGIGARIDGLFDVRFDDGRTANEVVPPESATDGAEMARLGYDLVRLAVSWSALEPVEGQLSEDALKALDKAIDGFTDAGLHVIVDLHQDAWSKEIGEDGAPAWAIVPPPPMPLEGPLFPGPGLDCPCDDLAQRRASKPVLDAFASFFENREQLQDRFLPVWTALVARYADRPGVLGFEAMNEPVAMHVDGGQGLLAAFHGKALAAMRAAEQSPDAGTGGDGGTVRPHLYVLEPEVDARGHGGVERPVSPPGDANLLYAPHLGAVGDGSAALATLATTLDDMQAEAKAWGAALAIGAWSATLDTTTSRPFIDALHAAAAGRGVGLVQWSWKEYPPKDATSGFSAPFEWSWSKGAFTTIQPGVSYVSRPYPVAVPGRLVAHTFDPDANVLDVRFLSSGGEAAPVLFLPAPRFPDGVVVELDGTAVAVPIERVTQRGVVPWDGAAGEHRVVARPRAR